MKSCGYDDLHDTLQIYKFSVIRNITGVTCGKMYFFSVLTRFIPFNRWSGINLEFSGSRVEVFVILLKLLLLKFRSRRLVHYMSF